MCDNVNCSVYIYGSSSKACPDCGFEGKRLSPEQKKQFLVLYREVQES